MSSIFSKIVSGQIPCHKVAETELYLAFLDINPLSKGHTLVIPKQETDYIFDLEDPLLSGLMLFAKKVAKAIEQTVPCQRIGVAVIGLEVPHAHIHLVPINHIHDLDFSKTRVTMSREEYADLAQAIGDLVAVLGSG
ncbi:MAG: HIT family protein [Sphingobacteriales bacterium]|nr:MAG: HIT family protein [Sphingobacteriales bacterium]